MAYTERKLRPNPLGPAVRAARLAAHLDQTSLSEAMGYPYNVVMTWENGGKRIYTAEWVQLCALLPALDLHLPAQHPDALNPKDKEGEGRATGTRPSRKDAGVAAVLRQLVARQSSLSVSDHAQAAGLDYVSFWSMTKGKNSPTIAQLRTLAAYFKVDVDQLLGLRPLEAASYAALQALATRQKTQLDEQAKQLADMDRIREMNDLLRGKTGKP